MKIKTIKAVDVALPKKVPKTIAKRPSWRHSAPIGLPMNKFEDFPPDVPGKSPGIAGKSVWVQITAEDGTWGLGRTSFGMPIASLIDHFYAPLLTGRDCFATEHLNDMMWRASKRHGSVGLSACAQSAVDLALWDLKGKLLDQPVYRLLGGPARKKIQCYCTGDDLDWSIELGFKHFKITNPVYYDQGITGLNIMEDKVAKARDQIGRESELMINPVMAYDVEFAIRLAERLKPYELRWMEEPLIPEDLEGHIQLRKAVPFMPIATGEDHHTRIPFRQLVENRCVDVVQPDLHWCGGMTEAIKIYHIAEAAGIKSSPHAGLNSAYGQHFCYAMPECSLSEFHLSTAVGVPLEEMSAIPGVEVPKDGYLIPSDSPGFGQEISEDWITPYRYAVGEKRGGDVVL